MRIDIRTRSLTVTHAIREYIEHRAGFAFRGFSPDVHVVSVTLTDLNGPRGGLDKQCTVRVASSKSVRVVVSEKGEALHAVIDRALTRAGRSLARSRDRVLARVDRMSLRTDSHNTPPHLLTP